MAGPTPGNWSNSSAEAELISTNFGFADDADGPDVLGACHAGEATKHNEAAVISKSLAAKRLTRDIIRS